MLIMTSHNQNTTIGNISCTGNDADGSVQDWNIDTTSIVGGIAEESRGVDDRSHQQQSKSNAAAATTSDAATAVPTSSSYGPMSSSSALLGTTNSQLSLLKFPFPWKLHQLLEDAEKTGNESIISWLPPSNGSRGFQVHLPDEFTNTIMPLYFRQTKYKSFTRQLHMYGFSRKPSIENGFYHPKFVRGDRMLSLSITRRKDGSTRSAGVSPKPAPTEVKQASRGPCHHQSSLTPTTITNTSVVRQIPPQAMHSFSVHQNCAPSPSLSIPRQSQPSQLMIQSQISLRDYNMQTSFFGAAASFRTKRGNTGTSTGAIPGNNQSLAMLSSTTTSQQGDNDDAFLLRSLEPRPIEEMIMDSKQGTSKKRTGRQRNSIHFEDIDALFQH